MYRFGIGREIIRTTKTTPQTALKWLSSFSVFRFWVLYRAKQDCPVILLSPISKFSSLALFVDQELYQSCYMGCFLRICAGLYFEVSSIIQRRFLSETPSIIASHPLSE